MAPYDKASLKRLLKKLNESTKLPEAEKASYRLILETQIAELEADRKLLKKVVV